MKKYIALVLLISLYSCNTSIPLRKDYFSKPTTVGIVFKKLPNFGQYPNNEGGMSGGGLVGVGITAIADGVQSKRNRNISDSIMISDIFVNMAQSVGEEFKKRGKEVVIIKEFLDQSNWPKIQVEGNFYNYIIKDYCNQKGIDELFVIDVVQYGFWKDTGQYFSYMNTVPYLVEKKSNQYIWRYQFNKQCCMTKLEGYHRTRPDAMTYAISLQNTFEYAKNQMFADMDKVKK